jgi:NTP pyrophosphatase (non-canonical NTP hydrolase)
MLNKLSEQIHKNAVEHGWWEDKRSFGDIIALCHSELSEALEEYRAGKGPTETYYIDKTTGEQVCGIKEGMKPEGIAIELADCIIRILDFCGKEEIDIEAAIRIKHEYNKTRPYRHGGKTI